MKRDNQGGFNNKFASYLDNILKKEQKERIFGDQFKDKKKSNPFPFSDMGASTYEAKSISKRPSSDAKEETPVRKRLKKLKELQENQCGICLQQIQKRCQLKCKHMFCFDCVQSWFESSSNCPYCRQEVRSFWFKGEEHLVRQKRQAVQEESYDSDYEGDGGQMDYLCYKCENTQQGDIVLICDRCQISACHVECDQKLKGVPEGEWYCHFCR